MIAEGATLQMASEGRFPLDLLGRLVSLAASSYDVPEIQAVNDHLAEHYARCGFRVARIAIAGRGDLLVAEMSTGGSGAAAAASTTVGRRVTIVGHSDTVWPAGSVPAPRLLVDEQGSRWSGSGIGDMKAALLVAADAARIAASRLREAPPGLIRIVLVPDEELGSVNSATAIAGLVSETDLCIGLEAGKPDGSFVTSRGAVGALRIEARGRAAHVTEPGGVNAVESLLEVLGRVRELAIEGAQLSITQVAGGTARQIAAADASAWIDLRCEDQEGMTRAVAEIEGIVVSVQDTSAASVSLTGGQTRPALPRGSAERPWAILRSIGGLAPTGVHERGGSDASTFAAAGVPTIDGFGPVCFDNCAPTESIAVESIGSRTAAMAALITRWSLEGTQP